MLKFRKNDHEHNLLVAVGNWVKANGGSVVVAGGIQVQKWPMDDEYKFTIGIKCTGNPPVSTKDIANG